MRLPRKKIGIDGRELLKGRITGVARFLSNFVGCAPKARPHWEFIVFGNQNTFFQHDFPNMKKIVIREKSTLFWDQIALPEFLKKEEIDVFFSPHYKGPVFSPCPTVITVHDITPFVKFGNPARNHPGLLRTGSLLKLWSALMAKRAKKIITVSNHSKKDIMSLFAIPERKLEVVYECVGEEFGPKAENEIEKSKRKYGIKGKYIFYIGNFKPHKNVDGVIKAYSSLRSELRDEYCLIIGGRNGENFLRIKKLSEELGIRQKVFFPGFIEEGDLPAIYSGTEIFVFPSLYEGFGLPPLEAMACGAPVIGSDRTSLPEILGDAAVLVNPQRPNEIARAMKKLLADNKLRERLRDEGLKKANDFSRSKMCEKILSVFEQIL